MDRLQEKTTAPYPPVGADGGQSLSQKPNQSIAEGVTEHKPPERDLEIIHLSSRPVIFTALIDSVSVFCSTSSCKGNPPFQRQEPYRSWFTCAA